MYSVLPEGLNADRGAFRKTMFWLVGIKYGITHGNLMLSLEV